MKDTRPIDRQVRELTAEQKKTIRRVGVTYDIIMCLVVLIYIAVAVVFMVQLGTANHELEHISFYKTVTENGKTTEVYDDAAYPRYISLVEQQERTMSTFVTVAAIGFVAVLAVMFAGLLFIHSKYPYYSDKRFLYISRQNRKAKK